MAENNSINNTSSILDAGNLKLSGNTLSSTDVNGSITILPDGTGLVSVAGAYTIPRVDGSAGQVLSTNGAGEVSFITNASSSGFNEVKIVSFTASGTYTPTVGMDYCIIEIVGGGGGGGSPNAGGSATAGGGGGSGSYTRTTLTAAAVGVNKAVTIGAAGTSVAGSIGGTGGVTSVGALATANGGLGGGIVIVGDYSPGGAGGALAGSGNSRIAGTAGGIGYAIPTTPVAIVSGKGADSYFSQGGPSSYSRFNTNVGVIANGGVGSGGNGGTYPSGGSGVTKNGGTGGLGYCVITEYITT